MRRVPCAGGIVLDATLRLLLIQRGQPPSAGAWSVPGGRCLPGESAAAACVREVGEETGVRVEIVRFAGRVERDAPGGAVYVIDDFLCRWVAGVPVAGDDARDARWVTLAEMSALPLAPGLRDALSDWGMLPA
jgi:ADP-ribose pyrophosphatase YjhB (NUDIX family)